MIKVKVYFNKLIFNFSQIIKTLNKSKMPSNKEYNRPRFFVNEQIYNHLVSNTGFNLVINVVPNPNTQNPHPKGTYNIPNSKAIKFIESKIWEDDTSNTIMTYNWERNSNWHCRTVPIDLLDCFVEKQ